MYGNAGCYISDGNIFTFQLGEGEEFFHGDQLIQSPAFGSPFIPSPLWRGDHQYLSLQGYQVLMRGYNNQLCDEVTKEIKENRLLPRLYSKEIKMLYGHGVAAYKLQGVHQELLLLWRFLRKVAFHSWQGYRHGNAGGGAGGSRQSLLQACHHPQRCGERAHLLRRFQAGGVGQVHLRHVQLPGVSQVLALRGR